ncbi:MAG: histidine phosphatase family protein [Deltaproteobacteria bacterium]|nr:histidine phosphatase family protein [Deltaproteobacteria bacterium]
MNMEVTRVYLIRHGQVEGHEEFRYNGHSDVDVTGIGRAQMSRLAGFLSGHAIGAVYSSDLKRALNGARIIARSLGLEEAGLSSLRELHLGRWEGLTKEEAVERYPEDKHFSFRSLAKGKLTGGESLDELRERVLPALNGIIKRHRGGHVCIVAHGGVNRVILCEAMGLPLENFFRIEQDYGCLNLIDYLRDSTAIVKMLNGGPNQELSAAKIY